MTHYSEKIIGVGLTFDDVLLIPAESQVLPSHVDVHSQLTKHIELNVPLVSAAMDTVGESKFCIALAREGGVGIIHKSMSIKTQAAEVDRVKRSESARILNPHTLGPTAKLRDAVELMKQRGISGIPIVDGEMLVGILTNRDLRFEQDLSQPISAVMTPRERLVTAPIDTTLEAAERILQKHRIEKLLLVDKLGALRGLVTVKDIQKRSQFPNACKDPDGRLRVGAAVGVTAETAERAAALIEAGVDVLVVDSAHGHSQNVVETVAKLKARFQTDVIAGNVVTAAGARALVDAGADAVKVGVGPGSICTTRVVAGVGVPQITAVMQVVEQVGRDGIPVIADGGIRYSGDIAKAMAVGASSVMIGSLFAGTEESPGEMVLVEGRSYKLYRGMGSLGAMKKGAADRCFQSAVEASSKYVPEGIEGKVPYKGKLADTVYQLVGGLRASMGYCGVRNIPEFQQKSRLIQATSAGFVESHPHDVSITQESPNYTRPR